MIFSMKIYLQKFQRPYKKYHNLEKTTFSFEDLSPSWEALVHYLMLQADSKYPHFCICLI